MFDYVTKFYESDAPVYTERHLIEASNFSEARKLAREKCNSEGRRKGKHYSLYVVERLRKAEAAKLAAHGVKYIEA